MRVTSWRLHRSVPEKSIAHLPGEHVNDLWGYVQEDSAVDAFLLAVEDSGKWSGHERFFWGIKGYSIAPKLQHC